MSILHPCLKLILAIWFQYYQIYEEPLYVIKVEGLFYFVIVLYIIKCAKNNFENTATR